MEPTPRIPTWGTFRTGVKLSHAEPAEVGHGERAAGHLVRGDAAFAAAAAARRAASAAIPRRLRRVRVPDDGNHEPARRVDGKAEVHVCELPDRVTGEMRVQVRDAAARARETANSTMSLIVTSRRPSDSGLSLNFVRRSCSARASAEEFSVSCAVVAREASIRSAMSLRIPVTLISRTPARQDCRGKRELQRHGAAA